jgi:hypothetical protein
MTSSSERQTRRRFTVNEDQTLRGLVCTYGLNRWETIASYLPERTARQCRDRYEYYLAPNVYNPPWTDAQDELLETKVSEWGTKWVFLARFFPGRNGNHLKNRWYKVLVKKIPRQLQPLVNDDDTQTMFQDSWDGTDYEQPFLWDELAPLE